MKTRNIFWGLFFIFAAGLIIVNQLGIYTDFNFFKVAGGLILIAIALEGCINRCFPVILFSLAFAAIIFSKELQIQSLSPWPILLVALFASIGLTILFPHKKHRYKCYQNFSASNCSDNCSSTKDNKNDSTCAETDSNSFITCNSKFSATIKYVNTDNFQGADLTAHFGSIKIFFDNAVIQPGTQPVININSSFSGIELYVPKNWRLENQMNNSMGGFEEKNHYNSDNPVTVIITGQTNFCGVEITYC